MQDIISHVVTSHLESSHLGVEAAAFTMHSLQTAYEAWRAALIVTKHQ